MNGNTTIIGGMGASVTKTPSPPAGHPGNRGSPIHSEANGTGVKRKSEDLAAGNGPSSSTTTPDSEKRESEDPALGNGSSSSSCPGSDTLLSNGASSTEPSSKKRRSLDLLSAAAFGMEKIDERDTASQLENHPPKKVERLEVVSAKVKGDGKDIIMNEASVPMDENDSSNLQKKEESLTSTDKSDGKAGGETEQNKGEAIVGAKDRDFAPAGPSSEQILMPPPTPPLGATSTREPNEENSLQGNVELQPTHLNDSMDTTGGTKEADLDGNNTDTNEASVRMDEKDSDRLSKKEESLTTTNQSAGKAGGGTEPNKGDALAGANNSDPCPSPEQVLMPPPIAALGAANTTKAKKENSLQGNVELQPTLLNDSKDTTDGMKEADLNGNNTETNEASMRMDENDSDKLSKKEESLTTTNRSDGKAGGETEPNKGESIGGADNNDVAPGPSSEKGLMPSPTALGGVNTTEAKKETSLSGNVELQPTHLNDPKDMADFTKDADLNGNNTDTISSLTSNTNAKEGQENGFSEVAGKEDKPEKIGNGETENASAEAESLTPTDRSDGKDRGGAEPEKDEAGLDANSSEVVLCRSSSQRLMPPPPVPADGATTTTKNNEGKHLQGNADSETPLLNNSKDMTDDTKEAELHGNNTDTTSLLTDNTKAGEPEKVGNGESEKVSAENSEIDRSSPLVSNEETSKQSLVAMAEGNTGLEPVHTRTRVPEKMSQESSESFTRQPNGAFEMKRVVSDNVSATADLPTAPSDEVDADRCTQVTSLSTNVVVTEKACDDGKVSAPMDIDLEKRHPAPRSDLENKKVTSENERNTANHASPEQDESESNDSAMETDQQAEQAETIAPQSNVETDQIETLNEAATASDANPKSLQSQKSQKHVRKKHVDPEVLEIRRQIQVGCRDNDLASAMESYETAVSKKIRLEAQSFYNLLNLCDGLERSVHIGTPVTSAGSSETEVPKTAPRTVCNAERQQFAFRLKDHMKELNYPLNEAAYSAIVKLLAKNKDLDSAARLLSEAEQVQQCKPKLRLYSSILIAYCDERRMLDALETWQRLTKRGLRATEREYAALMRCATTTGDALVVRRVLTDIAEDVPIPSKETVASIIEWFELAHSFHNEPLTKKRSDADQVHDLLEDIHKNEVESPPDMGPVVNKDGWKTSSACPVDVRTGILQTGCLKGSRLKPISISERAWSEMKNMNAKIVLEGEVEGSNSNFQGGKKGKKRMNFSPDERRQQWGRFMDFLDAVGRVDVVIDGANVGKFEQNFADAPRHVDYNQIDWVVQHFARMGKRVLLVLHERHFSDNMMPDKYRPLQEGWERGEILYKTPRGMNDDWFWLHAAYCYKSLVVTNDEMRDHHFQMLAPRIFLRWKERHHIHFDFGDWVVVNGGQRQREVKLMWPEPYSRRIQRVENGIVIPLAKQGDEKRFLDGSHVACNDEPFEETYLCIRASAAAK
eukprot:scaffold22607_cov123-Cylindrotheca_fusiformis.AAC.31